MTAALADALARWRATRTRADADLVDAATLDAVVGWEPVSPRAADFAEAWRGAAANLATRGWAADSLIVKLPPKLAFGVDQPATRELIARFGVLEAAAPDPRVARALVRVLVQWPGGGTLERVDARAAWVSAITPSLDERSVAELERFVATARSLPRINLARAALETRPTIAASTHAAPPPANVELAALFAAVRAAPDDDAPRRVLADALLERGDPRGELIALQLSDADPDRVQALLATHGLAWLGALTPLASRVQISRGFVARLELSATIELSDAGWDAARDEPELATIEDLMPGGSSGANYARMIGAPALTALRRIEVYDRPTAQALADTPAKLEHVAFMWTRGSDVKAFATHVLPALVQRATLRSLTAPLAVFTTLAKSPLFAQLTSLALAGDADEVLALWPQIPDGMTLAHQRIAELDRCLSVNTAWTGQIALSRDGAHVVARATGSGRKLLEANLGVLPRGITRVELVGAKAAAIRALAASARARALDVVALPAPRRVGCITVP